MAEPQQADLRDGIVMLQTGRLAEAVAFFNEVLRSDNTNGPAAGYLGIALMRSGDTPGALNALGTASQLQPHDAGAQYNAAVGLLQAGRAAEAIPFLQYTLQLDPSHANARAALDSAQNTAVQYTQPVQPSPYASPASGSAQPVYPAPSSSGPSSPGMAYTRAAETRTVHIAPGMGLRLVRGLGWGAAYGQWWTAWNLFWTIVWQFKNVSVPGLVLLTIGMLVIFAAAGILAGLIIAVLPPSVKTGAAVGIVIGLILGGIEMYVEHEAAMVVNAFFWYFTGRYVGANIAVRVHRPIEQ